ncbi:MAG: hypothetical protein ACI84K_000602 [Pseudohongiellaceae bacterium]|jgi:hypothetical protein
MKTFLYWVESFDHGEDWFVVALNAIEARNFFALEMGYDVIEDDITSMLVCAMPKNLDVFPPQFADEDIIKVCDGDMILYEDADLLEIVDQGLLDSLGAHTRVVKIEHQIFIEGNVARAALQSIIK